MHKISDFANMGKALLIQALGIQGNYKEEVEIGIDKEVSGCLSCPYYLSHNSTNCDTCPKKVMLTKQRYVNERNRYGHLPVLSINPLKMLIHLHFMKPNEDGVVCVSLKELAEVMNVSSRTITNNMDMLRQYDYIEFSHTYEGKRSILIKNYNDAFKTKAQYGHGYVVIPSSLHDEVLKMNDVNAIRITMRAYLDIDNNNTKQGGFYFNVIRKSFKKIMHELPRSITKGHVLGLLKSNPIFSFTQDDGVARLALKDIFVGKKLLSNGIRDVTENVRQLIGEFNTYIDFANSFRASDKTPEMYYSRTYVLEDDGRKEMYEKMYRPLLQGCEPTQRSDLYRQLALDENEVENVARLAMFFSMEVVWEAMKYIYAAYVSTGEKIKNFGGLLRTVVSKIENESELIALQ